MLVAIGAGFSAVSVLRYLEVLIPDSKSIAARIRVLALASSTVVRGKLFAASLPLLSNFSAFLIASAFGDLIILLAGLLSNKRLLSFWTAALAACRLKIRARTMSLYRLIDTIIPPALRSCQMAC